MATQIECYKTYFSGNNRVVVALSDSTSGTSNWDYYINMTSATQWHLLQGTDEMSINPNTYSTSTPHKAKIVITESGGSITDCKYYVNDVEVTPSFSFVGKGNPGKTAFCQFPSANDNGQDCITTSNKWESQAGTDITISTTTNPDDTATKAITGGSPLVATIVESGPPSASTIVDPPPVAWVNV